MAGLDDIVSGVEDALGMSEDQKKALEGVEKVVESAMNNQTGSSEDAGADGLIGAVGNILGGSDDASNLVSAAVEGIMGGNSNSNDGIEKAVEGILGGLTGGDK